MREAARHHTHCQSFSLTYTWFLSHTFPPPHTPSHTPSHLLTHLLTHLCPLQEEEQTSTLEGINAMIARSDEEVRLFNQMDEDMRARDKKTWMRVREWGWGVCG